MRADKDQTVSVFLCPFAGQSMQPPLVVNAKRALSWVTLEASRASTASNSLARLGQQSRPSCSYVISSEQLQQLQTGRATEGPDKFQGVACSSLTDAHSLLRVDEERGIKYRKIGIMAGPETSMS